jgi:SAM-dependent methyltransferase
MVHVDQDTSAVLDYIEGVKVFNYRSLVRQLLADYPRRAEEFAAREGRPPATPEEAGSLYTDDARYLFACAVQRSVQQMMWATAADAVEAQRPELEKLLDEAARSQRHSQLELDPDLVLPDWYTRYTRQGRDDIHLVRGGYWGEPLVGAVYELGGAVYRLAWRGGYDARPGALVEFAKTAPPGEYRRVLDLGCAFGGLTRALRRAYPEAEDVVGLDLSAPALNWAHYVAEKAGESITYVQRDAANTGYKDESFDLIAAFLLLHEVPDEVRADIMREAYRLLRPGGHIMFLDIPPYRVLSPVEAYFESFDARANGENFWDDFLRSDFPALLSSAGFADVTEAPLDYDEPQYWGSAALLRTGEFNPVHRWATHATKPVR